MNLSEAGQAERNLLTTSASTSKAAAKPSVWGWDWQSEAGAKKQADGTDPMVGTALFHDRKSSSVTKVSEFHKFCP